ncbi:MAG: biopolymer transporter ExbD [Spirulina sp. SIO3F2]|nr:biopolymer transporter ExbD [Spirulina sp. SIO3F2]
MHLPEDSEPVLEVNLLPMIDVLFVVLIFVILVSLGAARIVGLPVNLPSAQTAEATESEPLAVTIQADGSILVGQTVVTLTQLLPTIGKQQPENALILLNADARVPHGQVVQVLDHLRQLEGIQIAIATEPANVIPLTSLPAPENTPAALPAPTAPSPQQSPLVSPSN